MVDSTGDLRRFLIEPYVGVSAYAFDTPLEQFLAAEVTPERIERQTDATFVQFKACQCIFDSSSRLREVSLIPGSCVAEMRGHEILRLGPEGPVLDLNSLLRWDPEPREEVGFLVFFGLGLWTTGFHDGDEAQLSLGAFRRGAFDDMIDARVWRPKERPSDDDCD